MLDHEYIHLLKNKNLNPYALIKEISDRILTTKSESWSYEKEHRYVMPIEHCNTIRYFKDIKYRPKFINTAINKAKEEGTHDVIIKGEYIDLISKRTPSQIKEAITDPESVEMILRKSKNVMFLKNISNKDIDSIYFGARHAKYTMNAAVDLIRDNSDFEGVNLYHYNLSKERYEIDPIPL
ncbi:hypothetical protein [Aeromonas media]|uniref:hypothetical protein n=1 Tax=Aeromonas media TaxID=651 RepID=UPI003D05B4CE